MKSILSVMEFMFAGTVHCLNMKGKEPAKKLQLGFILSFTPVTLKLSQGQ